jgi:hypothetical protein
MLLFLMVTLRCQNVPIIAYEFVMTGRTLPLGQVLAAAVFEVRDGAIFGTSANKVARRAVPDLLERFCRIAEAPDTAKAVVSFAKRWGLLGLCKHGKPQYHHGYSGLICGVTGIESFRRWRELALVYDAMRRIGLDLNRGKPGEHVDWQLVMEYLEFSIAELIRDPDVRRHVTILELVQFQKTLPFIDPIAQILLREVLEEIPDLLGGVGSIVHGARKCYEMFMGWLIVQSGLFPHFFWAGKSWNIDMDSRGYSNLPAILTAQLMLRVGSAKTQIKCSECPRWFIPRRNQRKYCNSCGIRAAWRSAQRKRRG